MENIHTSDIGNGEFSMYGFSMYIVRFDEEWERWECVTDRDVYVSGVRANSRVVIPKEYL